jgi:ABC-type glycerol-3-phosphate transport system permease component
MSRALLRYGLLTTGAVLTALPFVWMLLTAFKTAPEAARPEFILFPAEWQWANIAETFAAAPFGRYFFTTFVMAFSVTAAVILSSAMAGYAFARLTFPGRSLVFGSLLATMMVPFEVTLIPNFIFIQHLGWYNSFAALIIPWSANAFSIFLMRQTFMGLPADYFDAAKVDGCGHLRFLAIVAAPMVKPMMVTVGLFAFLGSYNALVWPLIVTSTDDMRVVQVALTVFSSAEGVRYNLLMCASAIVIAPTVALYFAAQRHFMESSLGAGIKG